MKRKKVRNYIFAFLKLFPFVFLVGALISCFRIDRENYSTTVYDKVYSHIEGKAQVIDTISSADVYLSARGYQSSDFSGSSSYLDYGISNGTTYSDFSDLISYTDYGITYSRGYSTVSACYPKLLSENVYLLESKLNDTGYDLYNCVPNHMYLVASEVSSSCNNKDINISLKYTNSTYLKYDTYTWTPGFIYFSKSFCDTYHYTYPNFLGTVNSSQFTFVGNGGTNYCFQLVYYADSTQYNGVATGSLYNYSYFSGMTALDLVNLSIKNVMCFDLNHYYPGVFDTYNSSTIGTMLDTVQTFYNDNFANGFNYVSYGIEDDRDDVSLSEGYTVSGIGGFIYNGVIIFNDSVIFRYLPLVGNIEQIVGTVFYNSVLPNYVSFIIKLLVYEIYVDLILLLFSALVFVVDFAFNCLDRFYKRSD